MNELERLLKQRRCHFELYYSSVGDFRIRLYLQGYKKVGRDLDIIDEQHCDLDYLISKCKVLYKEWLSKNEGGY